MRCFSGGYGRSLRPACGPYYYVLEFAQWWQQLPDSPVVLLAGTHWILQRDGVQVRLLAHPLNFVIG